MAGLEHREVLRASQQRISDQMRTMRQHDGHSWIDHLHSRINWAFFFQMARSKRWTRHPDL